jgi:hypothetical protein
MRIESTTKDTKVHEVKSQLDYLCRSAYFGIPSWYFVSFVVEKTFAVAGQPTSLSTNSE